MKCVVILRQQREEAREEARRKKAEEEHIRQEAAARAAAEAFAAQQVGSAQRLLLFFRLKSPKPAPLALFLPLSSHQPANPALYQLVAVQSLCMLSRLLLSQCNNCAACDHNNDSSAIALQVLVRKVLATMLLQLASYQRNCCLVYPG